mgnify:CR=1 FL=1|jgi:hypothetical protein
MIVPRFVPDLARYRVPQEEHDATIAARLAAKQAEPTIVEYWPIEIIEDPNAATCKHGQNQCARCGIGSSDVAHSTIGGRGSIARALGRKGAR